MPYPAQTFATIDLLIAYTNTEIVTNGNEEITAVKHNNVENGLATYIKEAVFNWHLGKIESLGGNIVLSSNLSIITTVAPTTIKWNDNFQKEYVIVNTLNEDLPLFAGQVYYDAQGVANTSIPAQSSIHIYQMLNGAWINVGGGSGGGGGTVTGARDGVSLVGANVVLGQAFGTLSDPAKLLEDREIPLNGFNISLTGLGGLGIGVVTPLARLHIAAGTLTVPPIIIEPGVLTTTPIDGAIEFDGTDFYVTANGVRKPITTGGSAGTIFFTWYTATADNTFTFSPLDQSSNPLVGATMVMVIKQIQPLTNDFYTYDTLTNVFDFINGEQIDDGQTLFMLYTVAS